jgi:hypothetical protein
MDSYPVGQHVDGQIIRAPVVLIQSFFFLNSENKITF